VSDARTILISGGSRGLGLALVEHFLAAGDRVATFSRRPTEAINALQQGPNAARFHYVDVDAADGDALRLFVDNVATKFGQIDVLVNNAGVGEDGLLAMMTEEQIDRMLDVNLRASLLLARACSRKMLDQNSGSIINIASIVALRGAAGLATYAATKAGQIGMTRSLARELGPKQIRVNAIAPGYLETEMSASLAEEQRASIVRRTPLGRLGRVEDVVPVVEFLLSPAAAYMTGAVLVVDGGASA
jgi:3-oxoacyl-[acyl-carrier protein] reductase